MCHAGELKFSIFKFQIQNSKVLVASGATKLEF